MAGQMKVTSEHIDANEPVSVTDSTGLKGTAVLLPKSKGENPQVLVSFSGGRQVVVPAALLVSHPNGTFSLPLSLTELAAQADNDAEQVIPVMVEELNIHKRVVKEGGVRVSKHIHEEVETVDIPLEAEEVEVKRVTVNRPAEGNVEVRYEGDTVIIPLVEEVLTVQKQLMVREEIHITKKSVITQHSEQVTLRREEVVVEPASAEDKSHG
jgi:uncharacterized protein (TIGR02271 family)